MKGSTHRRCYCRDPHTGKPLGKKCPKLAGRKHGSYSIRQELPPREDGTRRPFSRAGYESLKAAQADLDHVRALLALVDTDDADSLQRLVTLLEEVGDEKAPLPEVEETRRRLRAGLGLRGRLTVGEWLDAWFASKKRRRTTLKGYESHIRIHLKPRIGHIRLDRLNVGHLVEMFDGIADDNAVIAAENQARREQIARCKPSRPGRPVAAERALLAAERGQAGGDEAVPENHRSGDPAGRTPHPPRGPELRHRPAAHRVQPCRPRRVGVRQAPQAAPLDRRTRPPLA